MIDINPFDPQTVVLLGALNPVTILVAFLLGRKADQWQKIPVAAFAGAFAGFLLVGFVSGLIWALVGYFIFPAKKAAP